MLLSQIVTIYKYWTYKLCMKSLETGQNLNVQCKWKSFFACVVWNLTWQISSLLCNTLHMSAKVTHRTIFNHFMHNGLLSGFLAYWFFWLWQGFLRHSRLCYDSSIRGECFRKWRDGYRYTPCWGLHKNMLKNCHITINTLRGAISMTTFFEKKPNTITYLSPFYEILKYHRKIKVVFVKCTMGLQLLGSLKNIWVWKTQRAIFTSLSVINNYTLS